MGRGVPLPRIQQRPVIPASRLLPMSILLLLCNLGLELLERPAIGLVRAKEQVVITVVIGGSGGSCCCCLAAPALPSVCPCLIPPLLPRDVLLLHTWLLLLRRRRRRSSRRRQGGGGAGSVGAQLQGALPRIQGSHHVTAARN